MIAATIFYITLTLLVYTITGYPLLIFILGTLINHKAKTHKHYYPLISFLLIVHNGEDKIREKVDNTLQLNYPKNRLEIAIISDGSKDLTNKLLTKYKKEHNLKIIIEKKHAGKNFLINKYLTQLKGEIIVFSDTDALLNQNDLKNIIENFSDNSIGCITSNFKEARANLYSPYEKFVRFYESKVGTTIGVNGAFYAIRKDLFSPICEEHSDDFSNSINVLLKGYKSILDSRASPIEFNAKKNPNFLRKRIRITMRGLPLVIGSLKKCILKMKLFVAFQLLSHKLLRYLMPLFLILLFITNIFLIENYAFRILFYLQCIFYLMAFMGIVLKKSSYRLILFPYEFCLANLGLLIGFINFILGNRVKKWDND